MAIDVVVHTSSILQVVTLTYSGQGGSLEIKTSLSVLSLVCVILDKLGNNLLTTISTGPQFAQSAQVRIVCVIAFFLF